MDTNQITYFAETDARGKKIKFGIKAKDRLKHMYVIGKTGMGKSTLLENMAIQDIANGNGLAVIDPHGSFAEKMLDYIPEHRIQDVLYFAPFDMEYPVSFNVMDIEDMKKKHLFIDVLMLTFEKNWSDIWSSNVSHLLKYVLLTLFESKDSNNLLNINQLLSNDLYRNKIIENLKDSTIKNFWENEFKKYDENYIKETSILIQNKISGYISNKIICNIIGQKKTSFSLDDIIKNRKIFIANLSKVKIGEESSNFIGSMIINMFYFYIISVSDSINIDKLSNFYFYIDEFTSFLTRPFINFLSEARKYKLNLTIAHQYIEQMDEDVRNAVFGNVGTMITFRVGAFDAEVLEKEFSPTFTAEDLVNLGFAQVYLKLMIDGVASRPFSATTMAPIPKPEISFRGQVIDSSRKKYARERVVVEKNIESFFDEMRTPTPPKKDDRNTGSGFSNKPKDNNFSNRDFNRDFKPNTNNLEAVKSQSVNVVTTQTDQKENTNTNTNTADKNKEAFLKAKEELLKMESGLVIDKRPESSPVPLNVNNLNEVEKNKIPTQQNIKSLKDALSSVLKTVENPKKENTNTVVNNQNTEFQPKKIEQNNIQSAEPIKNEIPSNLSLKPEPKPINIDVKPVEFKKEPVLDHNHKNIKTETLISFGGQKIDGKSNIDNTNHIQKPNDIDIPKKIVKEVPEDVLKSLLSMD